MYFVFTRMALSISVRRRYLIFSRLLASSGRSGRVRARRGCREQRGQGVLSCGETKRGRGCFGQEPGAGARTRGGCVGVWLVGGYLLVNCVFLRVLCVCFALLFSGLQARRFRLHVGRFGGGRAEGRSHRRENLRVIFTASTTTTTTPLHERQSTVTVTATPLLLSPPPPL